MNIYLTFPSNFSFAINTSACEMWLNLNNRMHNRPILDLDHDGNIYSADLD